tara:strand:- start:124 stop:1080 length:957 start_codon:yes stop_codon:yes gene_type:complete
MPFFYFESSAKIIIKFSHVVAEDTPKGKAALKFKNLAESLTNGQVEIKIYPNSSLYKDKEELEAIQLGAVHMLAPSMAKFGTLGIKEFEIFDLPYLFSDRKDLIKITQGEIGLRLLNNMKPKGIIGLAYWDNGFKVMSSNRPMRKPFDLKGLKMRIQASKVIDKQMRALKANPQVMAFSEVYQALQTKVVDGTENTPSNFYTQKMHEVQKYVTVTNHGYIGYVVIVNKKFWENLPFDIRIKLDQAIKEATKYANEIAEKENLDALNAVKGSSKTEVYYLKKDEKEQWKKALSEVKILMHKRIGKDLINEVLKTISSIP